MFLFIYIIVGLFLGPSFLKLTAPEDLFSVAAIGFLFIAGLELSFAKLRKNFQLSSRLAIGGFILPFVIGMTYAMTVLGRDLAGASIVGIALAISAMRVVVQILKDLKIYDTHLGHVILAAAILCDVLAWLIFSLMIPGEVRGHWVMSHLPILFFFLGLALSDVVESHENFRRLVLYMGKLVFGPVFFIGIGMKIHLQESFDPAQCAWILLIATVSKVAGVYWSARAAKFPARDAGIIATVMNARGAMEVLFCSMAFQLGMIDAHLFTSLIVMAILSSLMASPLVLIMRLVFSRVRLEK